MTEAADRLAEAIDPLLARADSFEKLPDGVAIYIRLGLLRKLKAAYEAEKAAAPALSAQRIAAMARTATGDGIHFASLDDEVACRERVKSAIMEAIIAASPAASASVGTMRAEMVPALRALWDAGGQGSTVILAMADACAKIAERHIAALSGRTYEEGLRRALTVVNDVRERWIGQAVWPALTKPEAAHETAKEIFDRILAEIGKPASAGPTITAADAPLVFPRELTADLSEILGIPNFRASPIAHAFQKAGMAIPEKAEAEQAFVLHWLTVLALEHGSKWREIAGEKIRALAALPVPPATEGGDE